jgi:uncharacterized RDD family membrane protein YckC
MKWYYADAGRQVGPVDEAQLDELLRNGAVRDDTLIWREGMATWQTHSAVRGPAKPVPIPAAAVPIAVETRFCSECGRPFPVHELVSIGTATICGQCKPLYMQRVREGGQAIGTRRYAGFWIRFVARMLDSVIVGIVNLIFIIPMAMLLGISLPAMAAGEDPTALMTAIFRFYALAGPVSIAVFLGYEVYFLSSRGATIGKLALGLKVIRADGGPITAGRAAGRYFAYLLDSFIPFAIGFIMAGIDVEKRALHDRICDTRVIYNK